MEKLMKNRIQLLDCTLRDGGYVNDWEFGYNNLISIFERLVDTKVDIVEIGFLDERRPFDINRSIFPNTQSVDNIWGKVTKKPHMVVGMIDYGTCSIENIQPCNESFLDGIRVIFKKQKMNDALNFCAQLKRLGYKVFAQLVSITSYDDSELMQVVKIINDVKPYAVSMVDTYGLLEPEKLLHYYEMLDNNVNKDIQIGFHAHNNFQLAYANARAFVERKTDRKILVDGTLFGMGKSAGNAPLELLAKFLNEKYDKDYNINPMLEAISESINKLFTISPWGYKTFFYMSANNECHPSYVEFFKSKDNLSESMLNELLERIYPEEKKLLYDREYAEKLYQLYIAEKYNDENVFRQLGRIIENREILLIGPGKNISLQRKQVEFFIENNNPIVISINFIPKEIKTEYVFLTKNNRYLEMTKDLHETDVKIIATTNLTAKNDKFDFVVNREPLLEKKEEIKDNSFLMLLKVLKFCGAKKIVCAGLDGYTNDRDNYARPEMEYSFVKQKAMMLNMHIKEVLNKEYDDIDIEFITYSQYAHTDEMDSEAF